MYCIYNEAAHHMLIKTNILSHTFNPIKHLKVLTEHVSITILYRLLKPSIEQRNKLDDVSYRSKLTNEVSTRKSHQSKAITNLFY